MKTLEYYEGAFVIEEDNRYFLQKDCGNKPSSTAYEYSEQDIYQRHKKDWERNLHMAQVEKKEIRAEKIKLALSKMQELTKESSREIEYQKGVKNTVGYLQKADYIYIVKLFTEKLNENCLDEYMD